MDVSGNFRGEMSVFGGIFQWGMFRGICLSELSGVGVLQDYKSLHVAVTIRATLVNTQTHTHKHTDIHTTFDRLYRKLRQIS